MNDIPWNPRLERLRKALAALGEPSRFGLTLLLGERSRTVGELAMAADLAQPLASHHLSILSRAGLVERERKGRSSVYCLAHPPEPELKTMLEWIRTGGSSVSDRVEGVGAGLDPAEGSDDSTPPRRPPGGEIEDFLL